MQSFCPNLTLAHDEPQQVPFWLTFRTFHNKIYHCGQTAEKLLAITAESRRRGLGAGWKSIICPLLRRSLWCVSNQNRSETKQFRTIPPIRGAHDGRTDPCGDPRLNSRPHPPGQDSWPPSFLGIFLDSTKKIRVWVVGHPWGSKLRPK